MSVSGIGASVLAYDPGGERSNVRQESQPANELTPAGAQGSSPAVSSDPVTQAFDALAQDLAAGNLAAAQQDYANILQDLETRAAQAIQGQYAGGASFSQLFSQLGQSLQAGNLAAAQQTFATLAQDFPLIAEDSPEEISGRISVSA